MTVDDSGAGLDDAAPAPTEVLGFAVASQRADAMPG